MSHSNKYTVYRAGTEDVPTFGVTHNIDKVWLVTNPDLYYPLCLEKQTHVRLWKADIDNTRDGLIMKEHPTFKGICKVELKRAEPPSIGEVKAELSRLYEWKKSTNSPSKWETCTAPRCRGGMSLIDFSPIVQAVTVYMKNHYNPTSPEEFNFQAELKAASHWYWPKDKEKIKVVAGDHDNCRVITAVKKTIIKWNKELDLQKERQSATRDLEENIFDLTMYYDLDMEELLKEEASGTVVHSTKIKASYSTRTQTAKENKDVELALGEERATGEKSTVKGLIKVFAKQCQVAQT